MPNYKMYYINARGRAEIVRLAFAQAGVEYEDFRFERDDWPKYKSGMQMWPCDAGMILCLRPANERRRYKVTPSLIGWVQT